MAPSDRKTERLASLSTNENACTHCRERKIRCGRERPRCTNCKRDGVECEYSNPAKRVNHIKLLCNNVGSVEDRLSNIETQLSIMNGFLRTNEDRRISLAVATADEATGEVSVNETLDDDNPGEGRTDRHVVRSTSDLTDRYHGPCTLFALCSDIRKTLLSANQSECTASSQDQSEHCKENGKSGLTDATKGILSQMCVEAGTEEAIDLHTAPTLIRLPPKQLLLMASTQFLQQADYTTDIFVQSFFGSNMERIYSRPFTSAEEPWAICFNAIILLVLGPENSSQDCDSLMSSHFIRPFLLTVRSALSNPRVLMAAKIVNVQALALLSIAARMYFPLGLAESIFAQACVLARTMGLHQASSAPEGSSQEEARERLKVFTSLYIRDKGLSMLQGSMCWLPSFDCSLSSELGESGSTDFRSAARIQLAKLQDESYRLFQSTDLGRRSSNSYLSALLRIEQGLEIWADSYGSFDLPFESGGDVDLRLEFLAARICVFRKSPEPRHVRQAISDSRASCLLVAISFGKHDRHMIERVNDIVSSKGASKSLVSRGSPRPSESSNEASSNATMTDPSEPNSPRLQSLLDSLSVPAFFLLARNIIHPLPVYDVSNAEEDLNVLKKTFACYQEKGGKTQANNHTHKVGLAFEKVLQIVKLTKRSHFSQPAEAMMRNTDNMIFSRSSSKPLSEQSQFAEISSLSSPPTPAIPSLSRETYPNGDPSTTASRGPSTSIGLTTPLQSDFQGFDSFPQNLFFPYPQQHTIQRPNFNDQQASGADVSMNYCDESALLFDFNSSDPSMTF